MSKGETEVDKFHRYAAENARAERVEKRDECAAVSDLPARLRFFAFTGGDDFPADLPETLKEAADRIEYLESIAGAVTQAPEPSPFAKRQRDAQN